MDPLVLVASVVGAIASPDVIMNAFIPASMSVRNPDHDFLFHQMAANFAFMSLIMGVLLRYSSDIVVWKIVQASTLVVDLAMLTSMYVTLDSQGRLDPAVWRMEEWSNAALIVWVTTLRILFLAGVGFKAVAKGKKA